jgi:hypothetical protein
MAARRVAGRVLAMTTSPQSRVTLDGKDRYHPNGGKCGMPGCGRMKPTEGFPLESQTIFFDCPAYLDEDGSVRCGLPAELEDQYAQESTGGQLESVRTRCPRRHWFNAPVEFLTLAESQPITRREPGLEECGRALAVYPEDGSGPRVSAAG